MHLGRFTCSEEIFVNEHLHQKFNLKEDLQIVARVVHPTLGNYYLARKHKKIVACAQSGWVKVQHFYPYDPNLTLLKLNQMSNDNPYYWIKAPLVSIYGSTERRKQSNISSVVLTRFKEEDDE